MTRQVAILRGINVGGKRKIRMAELKAMCSELGLENIQTYIQSGNIVFDSDKPTSEIEALLERNIVERFGFVVPVIVRTAKQWETLVTQNPYAENHPIEHLHLTLFKTVPADDLSTAIQTMSFSPDEFSLSQQQAYILCEGTYHQSKLSNAFFEKKLDISTTTRNWNTVLKLHQLCQSSDI